MPPNQQFKTTSYLQEPAFEELAKKVTNTFGSTIYQAIDLSQLDVCFGGFSPTVMGDGDKVRRNVEAAEARAAERKAALQRAAEVDAARASDSFSHTDAEGNVWKCVTLDDIEVRIEQLEQASSATVHVPEQIDEKPVVAIGADAFASNTEIENITISDAVVSIGYGAFRDCTNLLSLEFSADLASFDSGWFRNCSKLEYIKLPGELEKVTLAIFDVPNLKRLTICAGTSQILPGAFSKSKLEQIDIADDNEFLSTDGKGIYSSDSSVLISLAVPCAQYEVAENCIALAKKCFNSFVCLEDVVLPDGLQFIGDYAYAKTAIRQFIVPSKLQTIGERAFFACTELRTVQLNDGLISIGSHAFTDTKIQKLRIPYTIKDIAYPIADKTDLTYSGENATFSIDFAEGSELELDEFGGLYRHAEDGLHLVRMLDAEASEYDVAENTTVIDESAFANHKTVFRIGLPEGLQTIRQGAFKGAKQLEFVELPDSLTRVEDEAFLDTSLRELNIPANLTQVGSIAFVSYGSHHGDVEPSLKRIEVHPDNPRFRMESGLLIEKMPSGIERVVVCTGTEPDIVIPNTVTAIAPYAFNGVRTIRSLVLSDRITMVEVRGLALDCLVEHIHVDLAEPIEGRTYIDFDFPNTTRAAQQMRLAFGTPNCVNVEALFDHYDNSIVNRNGFDSATEGMLGAYEQCVRIVERLKDPVFLAPTNRSLMDRALKSHLAETCIDIAKHDDREVMAGLLDLGYINEDNITDMIDAVGAVQDASMTNYLLEQKQRRFGSEIIDFEL